MALGGNSSWDKIQQGVKDTERLSFRRTACASPSPQWTTSL